MRTEALYPTTRLQFLLTRGWDRISPSTKEAPFVQKREAHPKKGRGPLALDKRPPSPLLCPSLLRVFHVIVSYLASTLLHSQIKRQHVKQKAAQVQMRISRL